MASVIGLPRWLSFGRPAPTESVAIAEPPLDVAGVHARHADFVWMSLQRLGARHADLDDLSQEVFVVVHRKLASFDSSKPIEPWLFGICRRIAAAHVRRAHVRREKPVSSLPETMDSSAGPDHAASQSELRAELDALLDELDLDRRAVFVMFELDEIPCEEIARTLGVPLGTVYSRLHSARKVLEKAVARERAGRNRGGCRG